MSGWFPRNWKCLPAAASLVCATLFISTEPPANAQAPARQVDSKLPDSDVLITLDATMKVIERELNSTGKVSWTEYSRDSKTGRNYRTEPMTAEVSGVRANAEGCRIEYHSQENLGKVLFGPPVRESEHIIMLGDYDYDFVAWPLAHDLDAAALRGGHPEWTNRIEPNVYVVRPSSGVLHEFWFYDEAVATRVAAALNEAASVCGKGRRSLQANMGGLGDITRVTAESVARLMTAIKYPRIQARLPGLQWGVNQSEMTQKYRSGASVNGERVTIKCDQGGTAIAEGSWSTEFRFSISPLEAGTFLGAKVASDEILVKLLGLSGFQADDLAELAASPIPELRIGAAANLGDQGLLYTLAKEDKVASVRQVALHKLTEQSLLVRLATQSSDRDVRRAAVRRLNNPMALASIVTTEKDWMVRMAAVEAITDQALLAKIAGTDADGSVRYSAVKKLTDQSLVAKIATENSDARMREDATGMLTDQTVLARIAIEDSDWLVRLAAVNKITDRAVLTKVAEEDKEPRLRRVALQKITERH